MAIVMLCVYCMFYFWLVSFLFFSVYLFVFFIYVHCYHIWWIKMYMVACTKLLSFSSKVMELWQPRWLQQCEKSLPCYVVNICNNCCFSNKREKSRLGEKTVCQMCFWMPSVWWKSCWQGVQVFVQLVHCIYRVIQQNCIHLQDRIE